MVLGETLFRRANRADEFRLQIGGAADPILNILQLRIVKEPIDGKIPA
jgi:hypothetical protein